MRSKPPLIDTNVILRYLTETPDTVSEKFRGVFPLFGRLALGKAGVELTDLVLFETFFVLTRVYRVPSRIAAEKLVQIIAFPGIVMADKPLMVATLDLIRESSIDLVDAYLLSVARTRGNRGIFSFDKDLTNKGLPSLAVE